MTDLDARAEARRLGGAPAEQLVDDYMGRRIDRRQFLRFATATGISAAASAVLLSACGSGAATKASGTKGAAAAASRTLRWRPVADVQNVDPAVLPGQEDPVYLTIFFETLLARVPGTTHVANCLAESFEASTDGLRFHFKLKPGIAFHGGYGECQASDVKYSFERIAGLTRPKLNSPYQGDWAALDRVDVESKYAGTIVMKEVFAPTTTSTIAGNSGSVISQKAAEKLGKAFGTHPVGTGPYEWTSWTPGQRLTMTKFADYGGANKAYAKKDLYGQIEAIPIGSPESAFAALESGEVDLCELGAGTVAKARSSRALKVWSVSGAGGLYYWLAMNVTQPPLTNIWLRKAIRSAINVPEVISGAYNSEYKRVNAILPPAMPIGYWKDAPVYNQDIPLAKSYLAKSGLTDVTLTLNTDSNDQDVTAAQVIAQNIEQIGVKVKVVPVDAATFSAIPGPGGGGKHAELLYYYYGGNADPNGFFEWWTSPQVGLWNWDHWRSKRFTDLTNEALATYDVAKRDQLYIEAQKLWDAESSMVWVCSAASYVGTAKDVVPAFDVVLGQLVPWDTTVA